MMKPRLALGAALLICASAAPAQLSPVDLNGIRRLPGVQQIKYTTDDSGRSTLPQTRPTFTQDQLRRLGEVLMGQHGGAAGIPPALGARVGVVMRNLDVNSDAAIGRADWGRRIAQFEAGFAAAFPPGATPTAQQWEQGIDALLDQLTSITGDPHTDYLNVRDVERLSELMSSAGYVGIGAHMTETPAGPKIFRVLPDSPASRAGLRADDVIVAIDRVPTAGKTLDEAVQRIRGTAGTAVELRVRRGTAESVVSVTRAAVSTSTSFGRMAAPGVGYVYFAGFTNDIDAEVFAHIDRLRGQGANRLVLDVRGNGGGDLAMAQSIISEFLRDGQEINTTRSQGHVLERTTTDGDGRYARMPVAVLIDTFSASASEVLAAALQDHRRAPIVGWQSYGKGTFQVLLPTQFQVNFGGRRVAMTDGTAIKVTNGGWYAPSGRNVNGRHDPATGMNVPGSGGVRPDVQVAVSDAEHEAVMKGIADQLFGTGGPAASDPALDAAVQRLSRTRP